MSSNKRVLRAGDVKQTKDGQSGAEHKKEVDNKKKPAFGKNSCNLYSKKDGTAESAGVSEKKKDVEESNMKLGQIYKIDQFITNTKVDGLQVLHTVSVVGFIIWKLNTWWFLAFKDLLWQHRQTGNGQEKFAEV